MAAKKGTKRKRLSTKKPRRRGGASPASGARQLLASAHAASGGSTQDPGMYMPSPAPDDGQAAAGLLAFYATADMLELPPETDATKAASGTAQKKEVPWPEWVLTLLANKLGDRLESVQNHPAHQKRVKNAQTHVAEWKKLKLNP